MGDAAIIEKAGKPQELPTSFRRSPRQHSPTRSPLHTHHVLGAMVPCHEWKPDGHKGSPSLTIAFQD